MQFWVERKAYESLERTIQELWKHVKLCIFLVGGGMQGSWHQPPVREVGSKCLQSTRLDTGPIDTLSTVSSLQISGWTQTPLLDVILLSTVRWHEKTSCTLICTHDHAADCISGRDSVANQTGFSSWSMLILLVSYFYIESYGNMRVLSAWWHLWKLQSDRKMFASMRLCGFFAAALSRMYPHSGCQNVSKESQKHRYSRTYHTIEHSVVELALDLLNPNTCPLEGATLGTPQSQVQQKPLLGDYTTPSRCLCL